MGLGLEVLGIWLWARLGLGIWLWARLGLGWVRVRVRVMSYGLWVRG